MDGDDLGRHLPRFAIAVLLGAACASHGFADAPRVTNVRAQQGAGGWRFDVTISHPDTGWDHYADGWEVLAPDGTRLGFRELLHPHVNEQPFTRSLSGVRIPEDIGFVTIRSRCNVTGWADEGVSVRLPGR